MTKLKNNWYASQPRSENKKFKPKWSKETVVWIIEQLNLMTDFFNIRLELAKNYSICFKTAENWIEMSRCIMVDMKNGLTLEQAIDRDKERRNMLRRVKTTN